MPLPSPLLVCAVVAVIIIIILLMRPRRFYFIRHGETILIAQHIRQGEDGSLSAKGEEQAERVGQALRGLHIKRIIASPYPRTRETAAIINKYLKVPIVYSTLLVERRNPHEIIGKPAADPEVSHILDQMDLAVHEDDFRVSDEENFLDLHERARQCLDHLARQGPLVSAVVTHMHFLSMLIATMLYRDQLHARDFVKLAFFNPTNNAGITVCEYHPWKSLSRTRGWEVISYNEQP